MHDPTNQIGYAELSSRPNEESHRLMGGNDGFFRNKIPIH
jgi:hypothetical protein